MYKKYFILLIIHINCMSCKCLDTREECETKNSGTINVPIYIVYIFGFVILLLVFLLIFLVFVLVKTQFPDILHKRKYSANTVEEKTNTSTWPQDKPMKPKNLDRSNSFEFKVKDADNLSSRANDGNGTLKSIITEAPHRSPTRTESSGNLSPRIIKDVVKEMPIILPEQMSEICKAVLRRANNNEDTGGSLHNIDQLVKEKVDGQTEKKYVSTPSLDLYDVPTSKININENCKDNSSTSGQNNKTDTKLQTKLVSSDDKNQLQCSEIYDLPKETSNAMPTNYMEPHFRFTKASENNCNLKQEHNVKTPYAVLSELNDENKSGFIDDIQGDHYEFPGSRDIEKKMYINANENLFKR